MKQAITFIFLNLFVLIFSSCSTYVDQFHRQLDRAERDESSLDIEGDPTASFRRRPTKTSVVYNNPEMRSTKNTNYLAPSVKREYKAEREAQKRVTASDLTDNGNDGSLWSSNDQSAFLFASNKNKSSGDIVQINVQPRLRNEITLELKKNFPDNPFEKKPDASKTAPTSATPGATPESAQSVVQANDQTANDGGNDKISSVIIEEINRDHLLVRGRKYVLFKNRKRMVEVQALVSRKTIDDNDLINSDEVIESSVHVIK